MRFLVTGASGFLGKRLLRHLEAGGHQWRALSRHAEGRAGFFDWPDLRSVPPREAFEDTDVLVHLAGEPVAQRWTPQAKQRIRSSRVDSTASVVESLSRLPKPPRTLICASAIGYYGDRGDEPLNEQSRPGAGFLSETCVAWEGEASRAAVLGIRVVLLRIGIVLGPQGGALARMLLPFRLGLGGPLSSGRQWMSWIHVEDLARMVLWAAENPEVRGPINAVAPQPVTNAEFTRELGRVLHRPAVVPVPAFSLRLLFGEMSSVLLASARVMPEAAGIKRFSWKFDNLNAALRDAVVS